MRSQLYKFIFVGVLVIAALATRGNYHTISQSAADIVSVTASPTVAANDTIAGNASAFIPVHGTALAGESQTLSDTSTLPENLPAGTSPFVRVGSDPVPSLDYHEALIADLSSGEILFGDHDSARWPLASLAKLMTATVAVDTLDLNQTITITPAMLAVDGSEQTLAAGDRYTGFDLLRIMLIRSSNVAAEALTEAYGRDRFLSLMNARAAALQMRNTYYTDTSGLSSASESSADDLLLLAQKISGSYPQVLAITRMPHVAVMNLTTGKKVMLQSINDFAGQRDFLGGKTGYTDIANGNLFSLFNYENRPVLVVIMGTDDASRFMNTQTLYNWFKKNYR
jgi:serine-type D-Ala-D-Ala carboxypeptidase (penicillin-binding protein 5/6)